MSHAEDTAQLWHELAWIESVCDRWEEFFYSLMDQPNRALALCTLGIMVVSGQASMPPQSVSSRWMSLFGSLAGRTQKTKELCALGLEVVLSERLRNGDVTRQQVRAILMAKSGPCAIEGVNTNFAWARVPNGVRAQSIP